MLANVMDDTEIKVAVKKIRLYDCADGKDAEILFVPNSTNT